jgi:hypothetical protein
MAMGRFVLRVEYICGPVVQSCLISLHPLGRCLRLTHAVKKWQVDIGEFNAFIMPTMVQYLTLGKLLNVEEIVCEAFQKVLNESKKERELINQAFLLSTQEASAQDMLFNRSLCHEIFDHFYGAPADASAPRYQCQRTEYLKKMLAEVERGGKVLSIVSGKLSVSLAAKPKPARPMATFHGRTAAMMESEEIKQPPTQPAPGSDFCKHLCIKWLHHLEILQQKSAAAALPTTCSLDSFPIGNDAIAPSSIEAQVETC